MIKRQFDIITSIIILILCTPLFAIISVLIRFKLGSPVIFLQQRPGLNGIPFKMIKFRTMSDRRNPNGSLLPDSERMTVFGSWLRKTSLDELPELLNVIKGDMSLVGPRPLLMEYLPLYNDEQARRHEVRPGITGWAQINGRNSLDWPDRLAMDVWYVDNRSFILDIKILLLTIFKVFDHSGIYYPKGPGSNKFTGND